MIVARVKPRPPRCKGAGQKGLDGRFPGDVDRCPSCGSRVRVTWDFVLTPHLMSQGCWVTGNPINGVERP